MIERNKLIEDLKLLSIKQGEEFTLASGQKSNIYCDVKQTALFGPSMHNLAKLVYATAALFSPFHALAGVPLGGSLLATMAAMYCPLPTNLILIRKEAKDHGTQKLVEAPPKEIFKKVILIEDVVTTGQSVLKAAKILEEVGYDIRGIVAVVDRRIDKAPTLGDYGFRALVDFEELMDVENG
jgi:orotate phosphoribosyltransferase